MKMSVKLDMRGLKKAVNELRPHVKKTKAQLVEGAAKGFTKNMLMITPPASKGATGSKAKQQGEAAIKADLARIMTAARRKADIDTRPGVASPEELHTRFRDKRSGRINPRGLAQPYRVPRTALVALQRKLVARVGWLAAGWGAAARRLGVSIPAWVNRQGAGKGFISITRSGALFRVTVANKVGFVGNVKDLNRRMQKAVDYQANAMRRQVEYLMKKGIRKAGFKT